MFDCSSPCKQKKVQINVKPHGVTQKLPRMEDIIKKNVII